MWEPTFAAIVFRSCFAGISIAVTVSSQNCTMSMSATFYGIDIEMHVSTNLLYFVDKVFVVYEIYPVIADPMRQHTEDPAHVVSWSCVSSSWNATTYLSFTNLCASGEVSLSVSACQLGGALIFG
jgi:hypothetical protein